MCAKRMSWIPLAALCAANTIVGFARAGDPTPPPGPVVGTMKTLDEVEARLPLNQDTAPGDADSTFRIVQTGSYYLTENLIAEQGKDGIAIVANNVTVDLNGFTLIGLNVNRTAITVGLSGGLQVALPRTHVVIRNGHIRDWGTRGIFGAFIYGVLEDISIDSCGGPGLEIPAIGAIQVRDCRITNNLGDGVINDGFHTTLERCLIADNGGNGVTSNQIALTLIRTRVVGNQLGGLLLNAEAVVQDSFIMDNRTSWGIEANERILVSGTVLAGNGVDRNQQAGFVGGILLKSLSDVRDSYFTRHFGYDLEITGTENFVADNFFGSSIIFNTLAGGDLSSFMIRNFYKSGPDRQFGQPLPAGIGQLLSTDNVELDDRPHSNYIGAPPLQ